MTEYMEIYGCFNENPTPYPPLAVVAKDIKLIKKKISYLNRIALSGDILVTSIEGNNKTNIQMSKVPAFSIKISFKSSCTGTKSM